MLILHQVIPYGPEGEWARGKLLISFVFNLFEFIYYIYMDVCIFF